MIPTVRILLERANVGFEYVDIHSDLRARERVREINHGYESVPTLVFPDGSTLTEPTAAELKAKLRSLGHEISSPTWAQRMQLIVQHPATQVVGIGLLLAGIFGDLTWLLVVGAVLLALGLLTRRLG
jgi:mycoredoxin